MHDSLIRELIGRFHGYEINTGACTAMAGCNWGRALAAMLGGGLVHPEDVCWHSSAVHAGLPAARRLGQSYLMTAADPASPCGIACASAAAEGDAFHVAFKDVQAAVLFCMEVQYQASLRRGTKGGGAAVAGWPPNCSSALLASGRHPVLCMPSLLSLSDNLLRLLLVFPPVRCWIWSGRARCCAWGPARRSRRPTARWPTGEGVGGGVGRGGGGGATGWNLFGARLCPAPNCGACI